MYNIKIKLEPFELIFGGLFLGIGILFFAILLGISIKTSQKKDALDGTTNVVGYTIRCHDNDEGNEMCSPVFEYKVNGEIYKCSSSASTSTRNFDKYKNVYYDTNNPADCLSDYDISNSKFWLFGLILPIVCIAIGVGTFVLAGKRMKRLKKLNKVGVLCKNLPYRMTNSNVSVNDRVVLNIEVEFTFPDGKTEILHSRPVYSGQTRDADGMVDLLYDPDDYSNYYIDFNIEQKY